MPRVSIALGSNLGDRAANIAAATAALRKLATPGEPFLTASLHDTAPQDCPPASPRFLNTVIDLDYPGSDPLALLGETQSIERALGRQPNPTRNAPRVIDIDILLFGDVSLKHPALELPHPRIAERPFVLLPLREIRAYPLPAGFEFQEWTNSPGCLESSRPPRGNTHTTTPHTR